MVADRFVLDASALLALLQDEPGAAKVQEILELADAQVFLTTVNLGEVLYTAEIRRGLPSAQDSLAAIDALPIQLVDVDRPLALQAARLKATTRMGYADCFAAALARTVGAAVVTGDADFARVEGSVAVEWLPGSGPQRTA